MTTPPIDRQLLSTWSAVAGLTGLVPVPLLDTWLQNRARRGLVRRVLQARGLTLAPEELAALADTPSGGCLGVLLAVLIWPVKKVLRTVFFAWEVKTVADVASEVFHRALLLEEALDRGWVPGDLTRVRAAMDTALARVDTRTIERNLWGALRDRKHAHNDAVRAAVKGSRRSTDLSRALAAALATSLLVPELVIWFRSEMGTAPAPHRATPPARSEAP